MKKQLFTLLILAFTIVFVFSCKDDDDVNTTQPTCFDGIQNGDETGVDWRVFMSGLCNYYIIWRCF